MRSLSFSGAVHGNSLRKEQRLRSNPVSVVASYWIVAKPEVMHARSGRSAPAKQQKLMRGLCNTTSVTAEIAVDSSPRWITENLANPRALSAEKQRTKPSQGNGFLY